MKNTRRYILLAAFWLMAWEATLMVITFFQAYARPDKAILVMVNEYGEALPELVLIALSVPAILWAAWTLTRTILLGDKGSREREWDAYCNGLRIGHRMGCITGQNLAYLRRALDDRGKAELLREAVRIVEEESR